MVRLPSTSLRFQPWQSKQTREEVLLPVTHLLLICLWPVPEKGGQAFQPLKPAGVSTPPQSIQACADCCLTLPGALECVPLQHVEPPALGRPTVNQPDCPSPQLPVVPHHLAWGWMVCLERHVFSPPPAKTSKELTPPVSQPKSPEIWHCILPATTLG